ncbi:MAG: hypothetical protein AAF518_27540, partial [Spirochaetota bacterium]
IHFLRNCRTLEATYNAKGKLFSKNSAPKTVRIFDRNANPLLEEYFSQKGRYTIQKGNNRGVAKIKWEYQDKLVQSINYFDSDGKLVANRKGIAKEIYTYAKGRLASVSYYDAAGNKAENQRGDYKGIFRIEYNSKDAVFEESYFDRTEQAIGRQSFIYKGVFKVRSTRGKSGKKVEEAFYDKQGKLMELHSFPYPGAAVVRISYDEICLKKFAKKYHCRSEEQYFDHNLQATEIKKGTFQGIARKVFLYDGQGNIVEERYFGKKSKEVKENRRGTARIQYYRNTLGKQKAIYLNADNMDADGNKYWASENGKYQFRERYSLKKEKKKTFKVLENTEYQILFDNPRGVEGKRKITVFLDKFYRPEYIQFSKK